MRKPVDPQAAMAQGVDLLLRRFNGLDVDDTVPSAGVAPSSTRPIEVTYYVASVHDPDPIRAQADWRCSGVDDQVEISAALAAVGYGYGRVVLGSRFYLADETTLTIPTHCTLEGLGTPSTWLIPEGDLTINVYGLMVDVRVEGEGCGV